MRRLTTLRRKVLSIINGSKEPVSASFIYKQLERPPVLSSIYRSLSYLEEIGLIRSVTFDCDTRFYFGADKEPVHFIHCKRCHRTESFHECLVHGIIDTVKDEHDFAITDHVFYFIGICGDCRKKMLMELEEGKL